MIAAAYFQQKEFARALVAYQEAVEYPYRGMCGNGMAQEFYDNYYHQGLCREWLGNPHEAICSYFKAIAGAVHLYNNPTAPRRIAFLYRQGKQLPVLRNILRSFRKHSEDDQKWTFRDTERLLDIQKLAARGKVRKLISLACNIETRDATFYTCYSGDWEQEEAARGLAAYSTTAVPMIVKQLEKTPPNKSSFLYYSLALCRSNEATRVLLGCAKQEKYSTRIEDILCALMAAGPQGEEALQDLLRDEEARRLAEEAIALKSAQYGETRTLTQAIEERREDVMKLDDDVEGLPEYTGDTIRLPQSIEEIPTLCD